MTYAFKYDVVEFKYVYDYFILEKLIKFSDVSLNDL